SFPSFLAPFNAASHSDCHSAARATRSGKKITSVVRISKVHLLRLMFFLPPLPGIPTVAAPDHPLVIVPLRGAGWPGSPAGHSFRFHTRIFLHHGRREWTHLTNALRPSDPRG